MLRIFCLSICTLSLAACTNFESKTLDSVATARERLHSATGSDDPVPVRLPITRRSQASRMDDLFSSRPKPGGLGFGGVASNVNNENRLVRVFYATNRTKLSHPSGSGEFFSDGRGTDITYGFTDVSIPPEHRLGELERPSIWRFQINEDEHSHVVVKAIYETEKDYFWEIFSDHVKSTSGRVLVYIHGFANTFEDAAHRTAQMKYDLKFDGPAFFFSWPSRGSINPLNYTPDTSNMEWSVRSIANALNLIENRREVKEIILVSHSMGSRASSLALANRTARGMTSTQAKIRELVLAAPDIDRDVFVTDLMPIIKLQSQNVTIYASSNDKALLIAQRFHATPRLGRTEPDPPVVPGAHTIDASAVDTSISGHSYYAENRSVIADLFYLIHERLPPARRATLERAESKKGTFWRFRP